MGFPSMYNKRGPLVCCWTCEHFQNIQPFESQDPQRYCNGECRKNPPAGQSEQDVMQGSIPGGNVVVNAFFTFIPWANMVWCSGWQKTTIPLPPIVQGAQSCADFDQSQWYRPPDNQGPYAPRKKPIQDSCWYCEHFQTLKPHIPGEYGQQNWQCEGFCYLSAAPGYTSKFAGLPSARIDEDFTFPRIAYAAIKWCSKFERSILPVPDPPETNGTPCLPPP
jgi:hypothetical protein